MTLTATLGLLKQRLQHAKNIVGTQAGPLTGTDKSDVASDLTNSQSDIATALGFISNAGTADTSGMAHTLPGIAADCQAMAQYAETESLQPSPNNTLIGDYVKTINWQIDATGGYRAKAGIP